MYQINRLDIIIRSLYCKQDLMLIGTQSSEIFQLDMKANDLDIQFFCKGHSEGELWSLAVSPQNKDIFATASDDKTVR